MRPLLVSMRPKQWTKNLLVFAPLVFAHRLSSPRALLMALLAFVAMCLLSGAVYLMNDVWDARADRSHPRRSLRPVAAGELSTRSALSAAAVLSAVALALAFWIAPGVFYAAAAYVVLQVAYTLRLKRYLIVDAFCIAFGFVLRTAAGVAAVQGPLSPWLYSAVSLLALFLVFGKRRHELLESSVEGYANRDVLSAYSAPLLDVLLASATAATIVTYAIYSFSSPAAIDSRGLIATTPFVVYGLFRYLFLVYNKNLGGNPEEILLTDQPLIIAIAGWLAVSIIAVYI